MPKYVIANWKQNLNKKEVLAWISEFSSLIGKGFEDIYIIVAPSFPYLDLFTDISKKTKNFYVAGQNVSGTSAGRNTGQVGAKQLKDFADYCIVGHSETGVTRDEAFDKAVQCFENGIKPILCFVDEENPPLAPESILAWEDPENISTEKENSRAKDADSIQLGIQKIKSNISGDAPVVYGGSVNRHNIVKISKILELDGVLIGSASLDPQHFFEIVKAFSQ